MRNALLLTIVCAAGFAQNRPAGGVVDANIASVANLPAQKIAANDLIAVSVYDSPELTRTVRVGGDGRIRLPMLKQRIVAEGLLPGQLAGQHSCRDIIISDHTGNLLNQVNCPFYIRTPVRNGDH